MSGFVCRYLKPVGFGTFCIFSFAGVAHAELTAADVWADFKGYLTSSGYTIEAQESQSGNTLTISELNMAIPISEEEGDVDVVIGELSFTSNDDGSVSISIPQTLPMSMRVAPPGEDTVSVNMEYTNTGLLMTATGEPNDLSYNYTASELLMRVNEIVVNGVGIDLGEIEVGMANLAGTTTMKVGEVRETEQQLVADAISYVFDITDPETGGRFNVQGAINGLSGSGTSALPPEVDATNMALALENGFDIVAKLAFQSSSANIEFEEEGETVKGETTSEMGTFDISMSADGIKYGATSAATKVFMQGGEFPLPVEFAMGDAGFNITMPISSSDEEQDFAFGLKLADFTMSDLLWSLFDAGEQLPRDPATIALNLSGTAKLLLNLLDAEEMASMEQSGELPGELNSLNVDGLQVSVAGAELMGEGAFTFNNEDLSTFSGFPAPDGAIDLSLVGGNGLLDKLVAMGLVPEEQATGARLMLGLFTVPGTEADSLTSKIEVRPDGQVLANGQRLR